MLECYNWLFCNLIGNNRFSVILHKSMMLSRPDPLPFYERVWLRQTTHSAALASIPKGCNIFGDVVETAVRVYGGKSAWRNRYATIAATKGSLALA